MTSDDIVLIEKYIDDDLSQEEHDLFHSRMKDKAFSEELKLHESTMRSLKSLYRQEIKEELKQYLPKSYSKTEETNPGNQKRLQYFYWAAAIVTAITIASLLFLQSQNNSIESLFVAYYKPYPVASVTRGSSDTFQHPGLEKYHNGNYREAVPLLEELRIAKNPEYNESLVKLLLGNAYLSLNRLDDARINFQSVMDSQEPILSQHAKWYYALTILKQGNPDGALVVLEEIARSNSMYYNQANALNEQMKKIR